ncbi:MAG: lysine biosynthesis protein LysX [Halobacteriales archaeon]
MRVGLLHSRIREDEKLLLETLREREHHVSPIDIRSLTFPLAGPPSAIEGLDIVINRCLSSSQSRYTTRFIDAYGIPVVNAPRTTDICADKAKGSLALLEAGVPTPTTEVAFTRETALEIIERFGYPCVLKPVTGSWGRLIAKIDSRDAAEAILEHKETLGGYEHKVFYLQEFIDKPGRDIRVLSADGEPIAAMLRSSDHWLTNAARGATTEPFTVTDRVRMLVKQASDAVGGGLLGVDLMEDGDDFVVHEVNSTVEFKALNRTTEDVDVPGRIVDWLETRAPPGVAA